MIRRAAVLVALVLAACGGDDGAGETDGGGGGADAGPGIDSGPGMDSGRALDGGAGTDAGMDAGLDVDAGLPPEPSCDVGAADEAELEAALASLEPGDTVCLASGEWADLEIVFEAEGTAEAPITVAARWPGETILTGASRVHMAGSHLVLHGLVFRGGTSGGQLIETRSDGVTCNHCRITEVTVADVDDGEGESKWVGLYGQHNRVDHCAFVGKENEGSLLVVWRPDGDEDHHVIDHNYFGDRPPLGMNGGESIRVGTSDTHDSPSYTIVEHNLFERMDGEIEIISNKSGRNVYRHNTFRESRGLLTLRHGDECTVEGNWFLTGGAEGAGGIRVIGARHRIVNNYVEGARSTSNVRGGIVLMSADADPPANGYQHVEDVLVAFDTVVDSEQSFFFGAGENEVPPTRVTFAYNAVGLAQGDVVRSIEGLADPTFVGNVWHGDALGWPDTDGIDFTDPMLERAADGLYRPADGSPLLDPGGTVDPPVTHDVDGHPRDDTPDVGADERSGAMPRHAPLERADVGPRSYDFAVVVSP